MRERHPKRQGVLLAVAIVVLGMSGAALALDHFWTGAVSRDAADPRNWDNGFDTPTLPSSDDIVRIGCTSSWANYVATNQPILTSEWDGRNGGPKAGWWFVLGVGNQNTLTIDDGAYIEFSHNDCNLRNGGILHVMGQRTGGGPSLVIPPRFRLANNGDSIAGATGTLRIDDDGYVRFDPAVATGGSGGRQIYMGAAANALIEIRDDGILELVEGTHRDDAEIVTPRFDFASADPAVNRIVISGNGQLLLAGDPPTANVVGEETSIADVIDAGLITTDEPGAVLTVSGTNPTVVKLGIRRIATQPSPADGLSDVAKQVILNWKPGADAQTHDVYLGTDLGDVNDATRANPPGVLVGEGQDANTYDPLGLLEFGETYYWRVDEITADNTTTKGIVWQFEIEPKGYPIAGNLIVATASNSEAGHGPENTVNRSGLNEQDEHSTAAMDMWQSEIGAEEPVWIKYEFDKAYKLLELHVWNYNGDLESTFGLGLKEVTVEYSTDGEKWIALGEFTFLQGSSAPDYTTNTTIDFKGRVARYVRLVVNSSWGTLGVHGLSEVRFLYIPTWARKPRPESGAEGVSTDVVLTWRAGRDAVSHEVYFGTDEQAVADGTAPVDTVAASVYGPGALNLETTYHWRIDEVNEAEPVISWAGDVWHFTTQDSFVVDDFESYSGGDGHEIFNTWRDGYDDDTNGSQAGHNDPPYVEQTEVHGGGQSMPLYYGKGGVSHSEATRTFEPPQDWTRGGAQVLVLYFQGQSDNAAGQLYVKIDGTEVPYNGDSADLAEPSWTQWTVDLSALDVSSVTTLSIGVDGSLAEGRIYVDDIALYRLAPSVNDDQ